MDTNSNLEFGKVQYLRDCWKEKDYGLRYNDEKLYGDKKILLGMSVSKSKCWEYEEEWRLIRYFPLGGCGKHDLRRYVELKPLKIFMGVRISKEDAEKVDLIAERLGISTYRMKIDDYKYQLYKVPKRKRSDIRAHQRNKSVRYIL